MRVTVFLVAALVFSGVAMGAPEGFRDSRVLTVVAKRVGHVDARVFCAAGIPEWKAAVERYGWALNVQGFTTREPYEMSLSPWVCGALERWKRGKYVDVRELAHALHTFNHEAAHLRGVRDEQLADCIGLRQMVPVARRWFGIRSKATLRALHAEARRYAPGC